MSNKKGQLTLFIILGILIIATVLLVLYLNKQTLLGNSQLQPQVQSINGLVLECLEKITGESVNLSLSSGGIIYEEKNETLFLNGLIPYYNLQNISEERLKNNIRDYIDSNLADCSQDNKGDYLISYETPKSNVEIEQEYILIETYFPIAIEIEETTSLLEDFSFEMNTNLGYLFESAKIISENNVLKEESLCLSCVDQITIDREILTSITNFSPNGLLIILNKELNNKKRIESFAFALK
ncbi:hypothetical protein CMI41_01605 [Candidatus Pacearchaeota archaeon]|nr:hypothetical protein [Candidatus Pacearchaeota archaeon]|tara:strand:+ start:2236 stop:2955 length:720 start_codon:yes stop_codon:yes gene_type:complete